MAAHSVCSFNKFGYCKYRNECRKLHVNEMCDGSSCEFLSCKFRHPKICYWYSEYGRCKFDPCAFKHVESPTRQIESDMEILRREHSKTVETMMREKVDLKKQIEICDKKLAEIDKYLHKFQTLENIVSEKDTIIEILQKKISDLEMRMDTIEKVVPEKEIIVDTTEEVVKEKEIEPELFKCSKCKFESHSKKGLNIHIKRKHTSYEMDYPKSCDLCEKEMSNAKQMRKHMQNHSFTGRYSHYLENNYKCEDCEFTSKTIETMEVHVGKCRIDNFECGLCEYTADTLEKLETHLVNCEVYECEECQYRTRFLKEIKYHIEKEYGKPKRLYHIKMNRDDKNIVDFKDYMSDKV